MRGRGLIVGLILLVSVGLVLGIYLGDRTHAVAAEDRLSQTTSDGSHRFDPPGDRQSKYSKGDAVREHEKLGLYKDAAKISGPPLIRFALYTGPMEEAGRKLYQQHPAWVLLFRNYPDMRTGSSFETTKPETELQDIVIVLDDERGGGIVALSVPPGSFTFE